MILWKKLFKMFENLSFLLQKVIVKKTDENGNMGLWVYQFSFPQLETGSVYQSVLDAPQHCLFMYVTYLCLDTFKAVQLYHILKMSIRPRKMLFTEDNDKSILSNCHETCIEKYFAIHSKINCL